MIMNRRDRVLVAMRHEQPDYVPYNFHGTGAVYDRVCRHYNLPGPDAVAEFAGNHLVKIGSDFNVNPWATDVQMQQLPSGGPVTTALDAAGGLHTDEFGCVWDRSRGLPHPVAYPLADDYKRLDAYRMPDPYHAGRFDSAKHVVDRYRGKVFLFGKLGMAMFERAWAIRGMQQLLEDMAVRPEFVDELLDRVLYEWNLPIIDQQLALGVDGFYFADDWGSKTGLIFSPADVAAIHQAAHGHLLSAGERRRRLRRPALGRHDPGNLPRPDRDRRGCLQPAPAIAVRHLCAQSAIWRSCHLLWRGR